jgi:hypothetical protein
MACGRSNQEALLRSVDVVERRAGVPVVLPVDQVAVHQARGQVKEAEAVHRQGFRPVEEIPVGIVVEAALGHPGLEAQAQEARAVPVKGLVVGSAQVGLDGAEGQGAGPIGQQVETQADVIAIRETRMDFHAPRRRDGAVRFFHHRAPLAAVVQRQLVVALKEAHRGRVDQLGGREEL